MAEQNNSPRIEERAKKPTEPTRSKVEHIQAQKEEFSIAKIDTVTLNSLEQAWANISIIQDWEFTGSVSIKANPGYELIDGGKIVREIVLGRDTRSISLWDENEWQIITLVKDATGETRKLRSFSIQKIPEAIPPRPQTEDREIVTEEDTGWRPHVINDWTSVGFGFSRTETTTIIYPRKKKTD